MLKLEKDKKHNLIFEMYSYCEYIIILSDPFFGKRKNIYQINILKIMIRGNINNECLQFYLTILALVIGITGL